MRELVVGEPEFGIRLIATKVTAVNTSWIVTAYVFPPGVETVDPAQALFRVRAQHQRQDFAEDLARRAAARRWEERKARN